MVHKIFRARLRERREAMGMNQAEGAAATRVSQQYISGLERGANEPPILEHLINFAHVYGTSADYLLGITDDPRPPKGEAPPRHGVEVWDILRALSPARGDELLRIARDMLRAEVDANERTIRAVLLAVNAAQDTSARGVLVEALRLVAGGDSGGAIGLIEGYTARNGVSVSTRVQETLDHL